MNQGQIIQFFIVFLQILRDVLTYLIIGRVLVSWFTMGRGGQGVISQFLMNSTEPIMRIFKKLPHKIGMIDLSPIIALISIDLISRLLIVFVVKLLL